MAGNYKLQANGIIDILKKTLEFYKENYQHYLKIAFILIIPSVILFILPIKQFSIISLLINFILVVVFSFVAGILTKAICFNILGKQFAYKELFIWKKQNSNYSLLLASSVISFLVVGSEILFELVLKIEILKFMFLIPLVVLFLWFVIRLIFFVQCIVVEKCNVADSFKRSRKLTRQDWWKVFILSTLFMLPLGILLVFTHVIGFGIININVVILLLSIIGLVLLTPLSIIGITFLYFDLRTRKENYSIKVLKKELKKVNVQPKKLVLGENYIRKRNALFIVIGANIFLIVLKFLLADISGSVAIAASAWMSVENIFLTGAVLVSILISIRSDAVTKKLGIIENILAIIISIAVLIIEGNMFVKMFVGEGMKKMTGQGMAMNNLMNIPFVTIAAIFGAGICYFMSQYKIYIGKSCKSTSIEAAGRHCRLHIFMELAVIIGLFGAWIGLPKLNLLAAAFVLAYVIYTGFNILWKGFKGLTSGYPMEHACHVERNYKLIGIFTTLMLVLYFSTGIYIIKWNENGVLKRFGVEINEKVLPGLHYRLPWPIETVETVLMDEIQEFEVGPILLVAGDENIVKLNIGVHYNVKNASDYIFNTKEPIKLLKTNAETVARDIIGSRIIIGEDENRNYLLTNGKSEVEEQVISSLQDLMDKDTTGINIVDVQILALDVPDEVAESFRDIASAMTEKETYILEAEEYRNQIVTEAWGTAEAMINFSRGYKIGKINNAYGEASAYLMKLAEYVKNREITDIRLYLETMEKILPGVRKIFLDESVNKDIIDLLFIDENINSRVIGID